MENENLIYWRGVAVGIEGAGGRIVWFGNTSREAIEALS
jgi:hypothetical protein